MHCATPTCLSDLQRIGATHGDPDFAASADSYGHAGLRFDHAGFLVNSWPPSGNISRQPPVSEKVCRRLSAAYSPAPAYEPDAQRASPESNRLRPCRVRDKVEIADKASNRSWARMTGKSYLLAAGGVTSVLILGYVVYHYGWTAERQFSSSAGMVLLRCPPVVLAVLFFSLLTLNRLTRRVSLFCASHSLPPCMVSKFSCT